jgi:hypothetical protein
MLHHLGFLSFEFLNYLLQFEEPKDAETLKREQEEKRRNAVPIKAKGIMNLEEAQEEEDDDMKAS